MVSIKGSRKDSDTFENSKYNKSKPKMKNKREHISSKCSACKSLVWETITKSVNTRDIYNIPMTRFFSAHDIKINL